MDTAHKVSSTDASTPSSTVPLSSKARDRFFENRLDDWPSKEENKREQPHKKKHKAEYTEGKISPSQIETMPAEVLRLS